MSLLWRSIVRLVSGLAAALMLYLAIVSLTVWMAGNIDHGRDADVIVVMGAAQYDGRASALLESRLEHALRLWNDEGRAPLIAVTGGAMEGDRFTEAAVGRKWLIDKGVPDSAIISEDVGRSTWESIEALASVLRDNSVRTAIVVTSDYHAARSALTLEDEGFTVSTSGASSARFSPRSWVREILGVATGRIIGFDRLFDVTG